MMRDKTSEELRLEQIDLGRRLYYCSDSGEGRKVRGEIEKRLKEIDHEIERKEKVAYAYEQLNK